MSQMLLIVTFLLTAASYFYFHWRYFTLIDRLFSIRLKAGRLIGSFLLIYLLFCVCSVLELHLVVNWTLFFLFLLASTLFYLPGEARRDIVFFTMCGLYFALSINILSRCVISILINKPLAGFSNNISSDNNFKALPVLLGFLLAGAVLHWICRQGHTEKMRLLLTYPGQITFLLRLLAGLLLYLGLNLLLYQTAGNSLLLKLWGIKSFCFSTVGFYLGLRYALRMCELALYREEAANIQRELAKRERDEAELSRLAYRDPLTGCFNRTHALRSIAELMELAAVFSLCFIDLDRLKEVNDHFGHEYGDKYLLAAAEDLREECLCDPTVLFRYGGDEFILLFIGAGPAQAEERLESFNSKLQAKGHTEEFPFAMSVSFGVADSKNAKNPQELLQLADQKMYEYKRRKGKNE